jgi:hypothetical protein
MGNWFDKLARAAGRDMSRRDAVRTIGGGLLGALAVGLGANRAAAESVFTEGCQIKCSGAGRTGAELTACVQSCVACADPAAVGSSAQPGIVCSGGPTGLTCCPGTVYRTCKQAGTKNFNSCVSF